MKLVNFFMNQYVDNLSLPKATKEQSRDIFLPSGIKSIKESVDNSSNESLNRHNINEKYNIKGIFKPRMK